jgi:hypothetical protein
LATKVTEPFCRSRTIRHFFSEEFIADALQDTSVLLLQLMLVLLLLENHMKLNTLTTMEMLCPSDGTP